MIINRMKYIFFVFYEAMSDISYDICSAMFLPLKRNHDCSRRQILRHLSFEGMIFYKNRLPADDSREISCLICYFF